MMRQYDKQTITRILSKFMAGETSLDEEQLLADYFRTHEVGNEWQEYKEMFALFDSGKVDIEQATSADKDDSPFLKHHSSVIIRQSSFAIIGIAAAILIAFLLWPERQDTTIKQLEQQPVIAEMTSPEPVPEETVETETPVSGIEETPQKAMPVSQTKRPQMRKVVVQATTIATTEERVSPVIIDATPVTIENQQSSSDSALLPPRERLRVDELCPGMGLGVGLSSERQALADIYLAEAALQVAYQRQAQAEAMRAYAASLEGEETPPAQPIIAF